MSELGARFRREMVLRGFSPRTVERYERAMVDLIAGCGGRAPDQLTKEDVQRHLQRLIEVRRLEWSTVNVCFSAYPPARRRSGAARQLQTNVFARKSGEEPMHVAALRARQVAAAPPQR